MTTKFLVKKSDERNNFNLWYTKMYVLLAQQELSKALKNSDTLPTTMSNVDKNELIRRGHNVILLCLGNEVVHEVIEDNIIVKLWLKLVSLYTTKPLTNCLCI